MRTVLLSSAFLLLVACLGAQDLNNKATILSHHIILYSIDSIWDPAGTYTSLFTDRTKVEVEPGLHTYEFKFPKVGVNGRVYRVTFIAEQSKTYLVEISDTNSIYPAIIEDSTGVKVSDVKILRVSLEKSKNELVLPGIKDGEYATLVGNCCSGYKPFAKKSKITLGYIVRIQRIDMYWGPYPSDYFMNFGTLTDKGIRMPPGKHDFIISIYPESGVYLTNNLKYNALDKLINRDEFPDEAFLLSGNFEAGKKYGFDYMLVFDKFERPFKAHNEIKFVEVPQKQ